EKGNHILPHLMNEASSRLIRSWCEAKGVTVRTSTDIKAIEKKAHTKKSDKSHSQQLSVLLNSGESLPADMVIFATGTTMNTAFLEGSDIAYKQGVLVDECLNTTTPKVYAAGDVCQGIDFTAGKRRVQAIQLTASEHGRIAAANMCGLKAKYPGSITMNVLDTLGFVSSSFGLWGGVDGGESSTDSDSSSYTYLNLQFKEDLLIGATSLGNAKHISLLPRLIHSRVPLKLWKKRLMENPSRLIEAYQALSQPDHCRIR
ncbi:MAG: FAD-dependent oxidoreductase, partial [Candidatus Thiodiazotropha sp. (ex Lucinoma borealis)]|nr:FAD-dependent oxidoreductase [Candidatus Thiodiazotropha sp. (ex Lucinoma borealis)]